MSLDGRMRISRKLDRQPVAAVPVDRWQDERLADRQIVVLYGDEGLERFDRHLESQGRFRFPTARSSNGKEHVLLSTYSLAANQEFVLGFGALDDLSTSTGLDAPGFFSVPISEPDTGASVINIVPGAQDYYRVGHSYITALGEDFYFIRLDPADDSPKLYRYRPGAANPGPFIVAGSSIEMRPTPSLDLSNVHSYLDLQMRLDKFDGPVSLTSSDGLLYLTRRSPDTARTVWFITAFQPRPESNAVVELGTVVLPTSSANISVVQSASSVYVFEEGPYLTRRGKQEVAQAIVFPKRWIKSPKTSPLRSGSRFLHCDSQRPSLSSVTSPRGN